MNHGVIILALTGFLIAVWARIKEDEPGNEERPWAVKGMIGYGLIGIASLFPFLPMVAALIAVLITGLAIHKAIDLQEFYMLRFGTWLLNIAIAIVAFTH